MNSKQKEIILSKVIDLFNSTEVPTFKLIERVLEETFSQLVALQDEDLSDFSEYISSQGIVELWLDFCLDQLPSNRPLTMAVIQMHGYVNYY